VRTNRLTSILWLVLALLLLGGGAWAVDRLAHAFLSYVSVLPTQIGASLIAGTVTVLVATLTVVMGRYFERKKELDALHREKKTQMYDEFLKTVFDFFYRAEVAPTSESDDLVQTLREFVRKLILWSGPEVIQSFVKWKDHLVDGVPDAASIFLMEQFLLSIRRDLRHSNTGMQKGLLAKLFLREGALFLSLAAKNPNITLAEVSEVEKRLKSKQAK
jgi:hypothetical protein